MYEELMHHFDISLNLLAKLTYISRHNEITLNKYYTHIVLSAIEDFEKIHGPIPDENISHIETDYIASCDGLCK